MKLKHNEDLRFAAHQTISESRSKMLKATKQLNRRIAMLIKEDDHNYLNKPLSLEEYDYFPATTAYILINYMRCIFEFNDKISDKDISHLDGDDQIFIDFLKLFKMTLFSSFFVKDMDPDYDIQHEPGHFRNFEMSDIIYTMKNIDDYHVFRSKIFHEKDNVLREDLKPVFEFLSNIKFTEDNTKAHIFNALLIMNVAFISTFGVSSMKYSHAQIEGLLDNPLALKTHYSSIKKLIEMSNLSSQEVFSFIINKMDTMMKKQPNENDTKRSAKFDYDIFYD